MPCANSESEGTNLRAHRRHARQAVRQLCSRFEQGLRQLGELLGFEALRPDGQADPDGVWRDGLEQRILFEAKTEEKPENPLSAESVRQANTHHRWVENTYPWPSPAASLTIIVSAKEMIHGAAAPIAGEVCVASPDVLRAIAARTAEALGVARAAARCLIDIGLSERITSEFAARKLDTPALVAELSVRRVADG
jgi:hypothetical protein